MRRIFFAFAISLPMLAQYNPYQSRIVSLATNQDGSQLWFTSSVRPVGQDLDQGEHLWRWDGQRVHLVASPNRARGARTIFHVSTGPRPNQVAWEEYHPCLFGTGCGFANLHTSQIRRGLEVEDYLGALQFSSNGRYFYNFRIDFQNLGQARYSQRIEDWETGQIYNSDHPAIDFSLRYSGRWITNDGSIVVRQEGNFVLQTLSGASIPFRLPSRIAGLDRPILDVIFTGQRILQDSRLFVAPDGSFLTLELYSTDPDRATILLLPQIEEPRVLAVEGRLVSVTERGEVIYVAANAAGVDEVRAYNLAQDSRRVVYPQAGNERMQIVDAALSRDESTVFLLTGDGDIHRIRGENRNVLKGYGRRVETTRNFNGLVSSFTALDPWAPGGTQFISGRNIGDAEVEFAFGNAPVRSRGKERIFFQVPPEWPITAERTNCAEDCPFARLRFPGDLEIPLRAYGILPAERVRARPIPLGVDPLRGEALYFVNQDWTRLVSSFNFATTGEVVHVLVTNLGPISPGVPFGEAALTEPLSRLRESLSCGQGGQPVTRPPQIETLYAGLAPGLIGIYQLSLRVNSSFLPGVPLQCGNQLTVPLPSTPVFVLPASQ